MILNKFNRKNEIKKQIELYEKEQKHYKEELSKNPNYKLVYNTKHHL